MDYSTRSFCFRINNVLWKYQKAKLLTHEECEQYVEDGQNFIDVKDLWKESLGESIKNQYSAYDMFYAVLSHVMMLKLQQMTKHLLIFVNH